MNTRAHWLVHLSFKYNMYCSSHTLYFLFMVKDTFIDKYRTSNCMSKETTVLSFFSSTNDTFSSMDAFFFIWAHNIHSSIFFSLSFLPSSRWCSYSRLQLVTLSSFVSFFFASLHSYTHTYTYINIYIRWWSLSKIWLLSRL